MAPSTFNLRGPCLPCVAAAFGAIMGAYVLACWVAGGGWGVARVAGLPPMLPMTAVLVILCGIGVAGVALHRRAWRMIGKGAGSLALVGAVSVLAGWGIDRILFDDIVRRVHHDLPQAPTPHVALTLALIAAGVVCAGWPRGTLPRLTDVFGTLAALIAFAGLVVYVAAAPELFTGEPAGMAFSSTVALTSLSLGVLGAYPRGWLASLAQSDDSGGVLVRRLLPAAFVLPLATAAFRVAVEQAGLITVQTGIAIMTLSSALIAGGLVLWSAQDLSRMDRRRRREAEAVRRSESTLRTILETATDAIFIKDRAGRYLVCNQEGAGALGFTVDEVIGRTDFDLFPPEPARQLRAHDQAVMKSGQAMTFEEQVVFAGGRPVTVLSVKAPFKMGNRIEGVVGITRDITDRSRAERAVRASEARFRALLEADPDGVFVTDAEGRILIVNRRAEHLFGHSRHGLEGRQIELLLPALAGAWHAGWREGKAVPQPERNPPLAETKAYRRDGSVFDAELSLGVSEEGPERLIVTIVRDISERVRMQADIVRHEAAAKAAQEAARLKDAFLSSLSHEIKTPVSLIVGYGELMQDKYPDEDLLEGLMDGTRRLVRHIDDLLTYSALVSGAVPLYRTEVVVCDAIKEALSAVEATILAKKQQLRLSVPHHPVVVSADARRLAQIVQALLENAVRFAPEGGIIEVRARGDDGRCELAIGDNGPGMTEEVLSRIWEPFGQVMVSDSERTGGLGLGLKIARKLVELHGGTISILSNPGHGTTVTVGLPASGQEASQSQVAAAAQDKVAPAPEAATETGTSGVTPGRTVT